MIRLLLFLTLSGFDTGVVTFSPPSHGYIRCNYDHAVADGGKLTMHVSGCVTDVVFKSNFGG